MSSDKHPGVARKLSWLKKGRFAVNLKWFPRLDKEMLFLVKKGYLILSREGLRKGRASRLIKRSTKKATILETTEKGKRALRVGRLV